MPCYLSVTMAMMTQQGCNDDPPLGWAPDEDLGPSWASMEGSEACFEAGQVDICMQDELMRHQPTCCKSQYKTIIFDNSWKH